MEGNPTSRTKPWILQNIVFLSLVGVLWPWDIGRPFRRYFSRRSHLKQRLLNRPAVCTSCRAPLDKEKKLRLKENSNHDTCNSCSYALHACAMGPEKNNVTVDFRLRRNDDKNQRRPRSQTLSVNDPCSLSGNENYGELSKPEKKRLCRRNSCSSLENSDDNIFGENLLSCSWEKRTSNKSLETSMLSIGSRYSSAAIDLLMTDNYEKPIGDKRFSVVDCSNLNLENYLEKSNEKIPIAAEQLQLKPLYFEVPQSATDTDLLQRSWVLREIERVLWSDNLHGVVITGEAGTGKTSLILQLVDHSSFGRKWEESLYQSTRNIYSKIVSVETKCTIEEDTIGGISKDAEIGHNENILINLSSRVVGYHFCQIDCNETCRVPDFVHNLSAQLCQAPQLIEYRNFILKNKSIQDLLSLHSCIKDPDLAFTHGILEPLLTLGKVSNLPALLLIDSLHEAEAIATFIGTYLTRFPSWLNVIFSVRTSKKEITSFLPLSVVSLDSCSAQVHNDVMQYLWYRIKLSDTIKSNIACRSKEDIDVVKRFVNYIVDLSKGSFLYVKLILDLLEHNHIVIKSESFNVVPVSLDEVFTLMFNMRFSSKATFIKVRSILEICLASFAPLNVTEIFYSLIACEIDERPIWYDMLRLLHVLQNAGILIQRRDGSLMLSHTALREWLQREEAGKFCCNSKNGHTAFALLTLRLEHPFSEQQELEFWQHLLHCNVIPRTSFGMTENTFQALLGTFSSLDPTSTLVHPRNVYSPDVEVFKMLLQSGANARAFIESEKMPLLTIASMLGYAEIVYLLLEYNADCDSRSKCDISMTPLMAAASKGQHQIVQLLLSFKAKIELQDTKSRCALVYASTNGCVKTTECLLSVPWPCNMVYSQEKAIHESLIAAARSGNLEVCSYLLSNTKAVARINWTSFHGHSPLTAACSYGHLDVCSLLLGKGASVESCSSGFEENEKTALSWAASTGSIPIMQLLLDAGANVNAKDVNGFTALSWACIRNNVKVAEFLLEHHADIETKDKLLRTPIIFAAMHGDEHLVDILHMKGANIEHATVDKMTPLEIAVSSVNLQAISRLLHKGVRFSSKTWTIAQEQPKVIIMLTHKLLSDGAALYKKENFKDASYRFRYALKKCPPAMADEQPKLRQLQYHLLLGFARCKRRLKEYDDSIKAATEATLIKPNEFEAYYVRAKSRLEASQYSGALSDVSEAMGLSKKEPYTIRILQNLRAEILTSSKVVSPLEAAEDEEATF